MEQQEVLKLVTSLSKEKVAEALDSLEKDSKQLPVIDLRNYSSRRSAISYLMKFAGTREEAAKLLDQLIFKAQTITNSHKTSQQSNEVLN